MSETVLYTTHCPKCKVLEQKLNIRNIKYTSVDDITEMMNLGMLSAPVLKVDGNLLSFIEANNWVNNYSEV